MKNLVSHASPDGPKYSRGLQGNRLQQFEELHCDIRYGKFNQGSDEIMPPFELCHNWEMRNSCTINAMVASLHCEYYGMNDFDPDEILLSGAAYYQKHLKFVLPFSRDGFFGDEDFANGTEWTIPRIVAYRKNRYNIINANPCIQFNSTKPSERLGPALNEYKNIVYIDHRAKQTCSFFKRGNDYFMFDSHAGLRNRAFLSKFSTFEQLMCALEIAMDINSNTNNPLVQVVHFEFELLDTIPNVSVSKLLPAEELVERKILDFFDGDCSDDSSLCSSFSSLKSKSRKKLNICLKCSTFRPNSNLFFCRKNCQNIENFVSHYFDSNYTMNKFCVKCSNSVKIGYFCKNCKNRFESSLKKITHNICNEDFISVINNVPVPLSIVEIHAPSCSDKLPLASANIQNRDCVSDNNSDVSMTSQISSINSNKTVRIKKNCIKCGRNCFSNNFCSGKICLSFRKCLDQIHDSNGACIKCKKTCNIIFCPTCELDFTNCFRVGNFFFQI